MLIRKMFNILVLMSMLLTFAAGGANPAWAREAQDAGIPAGDQQNPPAPASGSSMPGMGTSSSQPASSAAMTQAPSWAAADEIGMNGGMGQMRTMTQAMRMAVAMRLKLQQKALKVNIAGINPATRSMSPLGAGPAAQANNTNANEQPAPLAAMSPALSNPDYFGMANWANSPLPQLDANGAVIPGTGIRKFVDTLPGLCGISPWGTSGANSLGQCIPVAAADNTTFSGSDYYEIAVVEFREQLHPDLPAPGTKLRGYVQIVPSSFPDAVALTTANGLTMDLKDRLGNQLYGAARPHYLGPLILATGCDPLAVANCTPRPVRVKFDNLLPTGPDGDLFIPTDTTYMGAGMAPNQSISKVNVTNGGSGYTVAPNVIFNGGGGTGAAATVSLANGKVDSILVTNGGSGYTSAPTISFSGGDGNGAAAAAVLTSPDANEMYTQNRATLHLHGGNTPWISDGTPHQWTTPYGELTSYSKGVSSAYVPDMWFDANGNLIPSCAGQTTCSVAGASNDPGLGALTFYWTNQQSGRLMFYHDHAYGVTRVNVYAGEAAGYLLVDPVQEDALAAANVPGTLGTAFDVNHLIPLVIQDKTFVPDDGAAGGQLAATDPTWDTVKYGGKGDLWFPHVYMPNQNPADITGANAFGRWDYGPWFWPPQNPSSFVPDGQPYPCASLAFPPGSDPAFPPLMCPGTPNPSGVPEGFMDTPVINGAAYPTLTIDPTAYRFQMLSAGNDRTLNLGFYVADPLSVAVTNGGSNYSQAPLVSFTGGGGTGAAAVADMSHGAVTSILVTGVGKGYTVPPNVTISGNGTGATANAVIDPITGTVVAIRITNDGTGYTSATVTIDPPMGCTSGCVTATATAVVTPPGQVASIQVTNPGGGYTSAPTVVFTNAPGDTTGSGATAVASVNTEVKMVDAVPHTQSSDLKPCETPIATSGAMLALATLDASGNPVYGTGLPDYCWPSSWPTDGRDGGVPDPLSAGPAITEIGTEGGLLPSPVTIPSTPVNYEFNRRSITVLNIWTHGLLIGPAERADVVVDFSKFAGKTLILYNDAPAPVPAFDPRNDYYTGGPDQTPTGGAPSTLPGYGPNTRTLMQIKVNAAKPGGTSLSSVSVTSNGAGYTAPSVSFSGGGGAGAAATASGAVTGLTLTAPGSNYTNPVVTISGGGGTGASAKLASGVVSSLSLTNPGSGYSSAPSVSFTGSGSLAAANTTVAVTGLTLGSGGSGYSAAPTVAIADTPPGIGTGALAKATVSVTGLVLGAAGGGYTSAPSVSIADAPTGTGAGAAASSTISVISLALNAGGSGYSAAPTVSVTDSGTGAGATANATVSVTDFNVTNGGANYTAAPSVTIADSNGGTGSGATAHATIDGTGAVSAVILDTPGSGYTAPVVTFTNDPADTTGGGATADTTGAVDGLTMLTSGAGYTAPAVSFTGNGIGAAATASGVVDSLTVTSNGSGYTAPVVSFSGGGGNGAAATTTGAVDSLTLFPTGAHYTAPTVTFTNALGDTTGSGATATTTGPVDSLTLTSGGAGFTSAPTVGFSGGGGSSAAATATIASTALVLINGGSGYTSAPSVAIADTPPGTGSGAIASATINIYNITLTNAGSGYTSAPAVGITDPTGSGAVAAANLVPGAALDLGPLPAAMSNLFATRQDKIILPEPEYPAGNGGAAKATYARIQDTSVTAWASGPIGSLTLTNGGSGYASAPTVSFQGGGGSGAAASLTFAGAYVSGVALGNGGSGYASAPTVSFQGGGGSGAAATASFAGAYVNGLTLTNNGAGYTSAPSVAISRGPGDTTGSGATATLTFAASVASINLSNAGSGYTAPATVSFSGGGGSGAAATTTLNVRLVAIGNGGSNYTSAPTVTFAAPPAGGVRATGTAIINTSTRRVTGVTVTNPGSGYISVPAITFSGGGGSGASATATMQVGAVTITNGGTNYTSTPTVTFSNAPGGTRAQGTAVISGSVIKLTLTNGGSGYTATPVVSFSGGGAPTIPASATASFVPGTVTGLTLTNGGSGYTSAPSVVFSGSPAVPATATASFVPGKVTSLTLTNPGNGYTSAPTVVFNGTLGVGGIPATASVAPPITQFQPKTIQELFTLDYGRMNATLGVELPFTSFNIQTTIPYGYIDPPTEIFKDGEVQIWKITHNGVDTHFIHFHLFNVQVINRVGWDGAIKPPDANEMSWKDTVRMNPLEDIIVAIRPLKQTLPWQLPNSIRPLDVTHPIGAANANNTPGFTNIDPTNQPAAVTNDVTNFGWEYVWHCHILGHEENDMMRAMILAVPPVAPSNVTAVASGRGNNRQVTVTWQDNSLTETGFTIQRATSANGPWTTVGTVGANVTSFVNSTAADPTLSGGTTYYYQVIANNLVGYTQTYNPPAVGYPFTSADSAPAVSSAVTTSGNPPQLIVANNFNAGLGAFVPVGNAAALPQAQLGAGPGLGLAANLNAPAVRAVDAAQDAYVIDNSPRSEIAYGASFLFNSNGATSNDSPVDIFAGLDQSNTPIFGVQFRTEPGDKQQVRGWTLNNGEQVFTRWVELSNTTHQFGVYWRAGTNGGFSLVIDRVLLSPLAGNSASYSLDKMYLGPSSGVTSAAWGTMYFDDFISYRLDGVYNFFMPWLVK